jgi:hypothetical protein
MKDKRDGLGTTEPKDEVPVSIKVQPYVKMIPVSEDIIIKLAVVELFQKITPKQYDLLYKEVQKRLRAGQIDIDAIGRE